MRIHRILGVSEDTPKEQVKKLYKKKAKLCHPDLGGSQEAFMKLNSAWEEYLNPSKVERVLSKTVNRAKSSGKVFNGFGNSLFDFI